MTTFRADRSFFGGPLAATGAGGSGYKSKVNWRLIVCPKCEAPTQGRCRRRATESFNDDQPNGFTGEGRWIHLKHPHKERVAAARKARES